MIDDNSINRITPSELDDLKKLILTIDPENKVFNDSINIIDDMEKSFPIDIKENTDLIVKQKKKD